jgi:hypothetical protein
MSASSSVPDMVSSASRTISTQLSQAQPMGVHIPMWLGVTLMFIGLIVVVMFLSSSLSSIVHAIKTPRVDLDYEHPALCEDFTNTPSPAPHTADRPTLKYQTAALTALANPNENITGQHILFGQGKRYITADPFSTRIEVFCNLFVINGNPYVSEEQYKQSIDTTDHYHVHLTNGKETKFIGALKKDGDGIYKLQYTTKLVEDKVHEYNTVIVSLKTKSSSEEVQILQGQFR